MKNIFTLLLFLGSYSYSQQYELDPSFGDNGSRATNNQIRPFTGDFFNDQYYFLGNGNRLARYNYNGDIDLNFGTSGFSVINDPGKTVILKAFKIINDKIYAVGKTQSTSDQQLVDAVVIRLNLNGTPDTTFGTDGVATVDLDVRESFQDVLINPDGTIFAIGTKENNQDGSGEVLVCKFLANGSPDTAFNSTGHKIFPYDGPSRGISLTAHGTGVLLGNWTGDASGWYSEVIVHKINANGATESSFGTSGLVRFSVDVFGSVSAINFLALKIQNDKIYCSFYHGVSFNSQGYRLQSYTLTAPNTKLADIYIRQDSFFNVLENGKIIVARGISCPSPSCYATAFEITRYEANGTEDSTFNGTGTFLYNFSNSQFAVEGATFFYHHDDGRILLAGVNPLCCDGNALAMLRIGDENLSSGKVSERSKFRIFPNPAKDILHIQSAENSLIESVFVTDISGKLVLSSSSTFDRLDISELQTGMYVIELTSNAKKYRLKFLKT